MAEGFCLFLVLIFVRRIRVGGTEVVLRARPAEDSGPYLFGFGHEGAEVGEEFFEVFEDEFPFDVDVGVGGEGLGFFGAVVGEELFDDGDDLGGGWIWAGCADVAAVAEGFEVGNFAGRVEGGEFGHGFWEGEVESVDEFGLRWALRGRRKLRGRWVIGWAGE